jgi:DHA1 family bicyclomycin/chloramphenicol resistance-like MFS transporter
MKISRPAAAEFIALMAMMTALVALSIDAILPALQQIGHDLGTQRSNENQLIISLLFVGFALGQLFYGPLSDAAGRKKAVYAGLALFIAGCLLAALAQSFQVLLLGRFLQGLGVAGPRTMTVALVRDRYSGSEMARIMSFVMAIFILIPIVAPSLGQVVLSVAGWRFIFAGYLGMALIVLVWFHFRQPETLIASRRIPLSVSRIAHAVWEVVANRKARSYTVASGLVFGAFLGYLNSSQQILQEQYALGAQFPLYFAVLAVAIGAASISNARLVMRHGMLRLARYALRTLYVVSFGFFLVAYVLRGHPPLGATMAYLMLAFFCVGILFGNLNALAMEPLGHIAGTGASVIGALSTLISIVLGTVIGQSYDGTILPLVLGFAVLGAASAAVVHLVDG